MARIAFCQDIYVEYMGFMYMSAVLKQDGHTVEIFIGNQGKEDSMIQELKAFQPDAVGFSLLSPSVSWAKSLSKRVKEEVGAITLCGNVHAITSPDELIAEEGMDIVCIGEGEEPMKEFAARLDKGEPYLDIPSFVVKTPDGVVKNANPKKMINLDDLPFHDRDMYDKYKFFRNSNYIKQMNGRGCPFHCSFCTNTFLLDHYGAKEYIRKFSPARAIAEVEYHVKKRKPRYVQFIDEVFWVKNSWIREFLPLYKDRIGIKFLANFRFGPIEESDIKMMAEAGAYNLILAAESGDEKQRQEIMNKPVKDEMIFRISGWFKKYGINFCSSCFFGLPGDTFEDHIKRLEFYRKLRPTYLYTTFFQPYPGVNLAADEKVKDTLPEDQTFRLTLHHEMYLDLPDKQRVTNLKKVYYWLMAWPAAAPVLIKLTKYRIPGFFDLMFLLGFTRYAIIFERMSAYNYWHHLKTFGISPILRALQPMKWLMRPFRPIVPHL